MDLASRDQVALLDDLVLLPREGAPDDADGLPPNPYALVRSRYSILVDAPFLFCLDAVKALADKGHPPAAIALTHADVALAADGFKRLDKLFGAPVLLHPEDQAMPAVRGLGVDFEDPARNAFLERAGLSMEPVPGPTPGTVAYVTGQGGGILFAGPCLRGAAPGDGEDAPVLTLPRLGEAGAGLVAERLQALVAATPVRTILPYRGQPVVDTAEAGQALAAAASG